MNRESNVAEALEYADVREGREIFVLIAGLATAMSVSLLWRGDYGQALLPAMVAVGCIRPIRLRPRTLRPMLSWVAGLLGIALYVAIRTGVAEYYRAFG